MLKIGIIGCGAIGGQLARGLAAGGAPGAKVAALTDLDMNRAGRLARSLRPQPRVMTLSRLVRTCDLVVEAAGIAAVPAAAGAALAARKDLLVMSIGALVAQPAWFARFRRAGCRLLYPSGAVAGLDGLRAAAARGGLRRVTLTTRKPPRGLAGAPFFQRRRLDPLTLKRAVTVFSGTARQAIRLFPQNINVAAAVSLAGIGPDRTRVRIIADPQTRRNAHALEAKGDFGELTAVTVNRPSPDNPKTSLLAGLSALAALAELARDRRRKEPRAAL
jgi:aspartate dehydrogenase